MEVSTEDMPGRGSPVQDVTRNVPIDKIREALLSWYRRNSRDLPWRRSHDPYHIWLSEVMLQQTQVDTALGYYERFLERFPTLQDLAAAQIDEVMAVWAGLGYYRRARHFHTAVQEVAATYGGEVPHEPETFGSLPGVGPYTTGAVLSIAFGERIPAVDGNVLRVLSRLGGISEPVDRTAGRRKIETLAATLVAPETPGDWNQAVMELGALICRPQTPKCDACPLKPWCQAAEDGTAKALPVTTGRITVRIVERLVAAVKLDGALFLCRRPETGLLAGMWDLPALEGEPGSWPLPGDKELALTEHLTNLGFADVRVRAQLGTVSHRFSHVEWQMWVYGCTAEKAPTVGAAAKLVPFERVDSVTVARATERALELVFEAERIDDKER